MHFKLLSFIIVVCSIQSHPIEPWELYGTGLPQAFSGPPASVSQVLRSASQCPTMCLTLKEIKNSFPQ